MDYKGFFAGKKITVMGLGLLGRGVGDTAFLSECGADLIVTDLKSETELAPSLEQLKGYQNIQYVLGEHRREDFRDRDFILKNPDVPFNSPYIEEAEAHNIPIEMSASLVAKLTDAKIVGITGSRGKSSATHLLFHILKSAGLDAHLGGNVRGLATLPLLEQTSKDSVIVMELDSWQLQGFGTSKISPHLSIFTSFYPDHMTYYKDDMQHYFNDKANIFAYQKEGDVLVSSAQAHEQIEKYARNKPRNEIVVEPYETQNPSLLGDHNADNAACAAKAAEILGVSKETIASSVESFPGVEGRLQFVKEVAGVKIYNDNNATSPDATIAGLKALRKNIILIMGGSDKGLDMKNLLGEIPEHAKGVGLLKGTGTEKIRDDVHAMALQGLEVHDADTLEGAVDQAKKLAKSGDTVLFSPAFASFGMFTNEYDRNDQFLDIVTSL